MNGEPMKRDGGGVLCYTMDARGQVRFLMQAMGHGSRKEGHLVDLGGGCNPGESSMEAAVREAYEEGMRFLYPSMAEWRAVFAASQPFALRRRRKSKEWWLYLVRCQYFDLTPLNESIDRTTKSRQYHWISAAHLLVACKNSKVGTARLLFGICNG